MKRRTHEVVVLDKHGRLLRRITVTGSMPPPQVRPNPDEAVNLDRKLGLLEGRDNAR